MEILIKDRNHLHISHTLMYILVGIGVILLLIDPIVSEEKLNEIEELNGLSPKEVLDKIDDIFFDSSDLRKMNDSSIEIKESTDSHHVSNNYFRFILIKVHQMSFLWKN